MVMRFAVSRHSETLPADWHALATRWHEAGQTPYAVLDGCMLAPVELASLVRAGLRFDPALAGSRFEAYGNQGPLICAVDFSNAHATRTLLRVTNGLPCLSLIGSTQSATTLRKTLIWLAEAHTEGAPPLHCRFADTRMLPGLLRSLTLTQQVTLAGSIAAWGWIDRDGSLQTSTLPAPESAHEIQDAAPFTLDAAQFAFMLTSAEPDMVFQMLVERLPELVPDSPPHLFYARLAQMISAAHGYGIEDLPDLFQYVVVGLSTQDRFDLHPALAPTWQQLKQGKARFGDLAEQWPDELWQLLTNPVSEPPLAQPCDK